MGYIVTRDCRADARNDRGALHILSHWDLMCGDLAFICCDGRENFVG